MSASPFDSGAEERRALADEAVDFVLGFIAGREEAPASDLDGAYDLARALRRPPPEQGRPFADLLDEMARGAGKAYDTAGPGYLAYIPGGGLFASAIGDMIACVTNRFVNISAPAPPFAQLEATVTRWLCDLFELPERSQGILTSGGSVANFSAIVTARRAKLPEDFLRGTLYVSDQVHASVTKAASLAGFPPANVRHVPVSSELRLDARACADMVRADRVAGMRPFFVVASAGTTNTGAVDPMDDLATLCADEGMWLHADAAYGGFFQLTERGRKRFRGIERADSITLDPHKGMFLPYGTGSLLVRDGELLREAHYSGAPYLQDVVAGGEVLPNFSEYSPELSRDYRGLRVWLPLQLHGVAAFRDALDEKLDLASVAYDGLRRDARLDLPWEPELSIVAFRLARRPGRGVEEENDRNRAFLDRINASKRVFLSSTMVDDRFTLRIAILSHRTHRERIDEAIEIIRDAASAG
jgi:aromatic-L-amino-acid decarboxylase